MKPSILLVDDNPANLLALEAVLDELGYPLVRALSGEEAVRLLSEQSFAVVLMDVRMPGLDGFETAELIRSRELSRHISIIFITAYDENRLTVEQAYALGAVDYLVKPLVPVVLRAKVAEFIDLYEKTEQSRRQLERALAEENARLRESEERFKALANHAPVGIFESNAAGDCRFVNARWCELAGLSPDEAKGRGWVNALHPEDRDRVAQGWYTPATTGRALTSEYRFRTPQGKVTWLSGRAMALLDPNGEIRGYIGTVTDITEQKEAAEQLQQRAERLVEADRRKDEFLAMLAHELRNPLSPIRNAAQVLHQIGPADANVQSATEMIQRQVKHLSRLVDDLLDVSRITRGKITLRKEPVELAAVVAQAVEASRPLMEARRHELRVHLPAEAVRVEADTTRLAQVVANLLTNAAKYTPEGGHIQLTVEAGPGEAVIRVRDNGMGMSAELLPHVFDLFTQGDRSLARSEGGLGIGLTLVKSLVEMHGGTVEAHSEGPGKGSEFVVRLPPLPAGALKTAEEEKGRHAPSPCRVLVVDDNKDAAESLALLVQVAGHEVRTAHDGPTALEVAKTFRPEVVFLDIGLPRMDGYEVARQLRRQPGLEKVVLAAVTGYGQEEDRRRTHEAGIDEHLVKPVDPTELEKVFAAAGCA
jgi:PAS domain S-box-containing protein